MHWDCQSEGKCGTEIQRRTGVAKATECLHGNTSRTGLAKGMESVERLSKCAIGQPKWRTVLHGYPNAHWDSQNEGKCGKEIRMCAGIAKGKGCVARKFKGALGQPKRRKSKGALG